MRSTPAGWNWFPTGKKNFIARRNVLVYSHTLWEMGKLEEMLTWKHYRNILQKKPHYNKNDSLGIS